MANRSDPDNLRAPSLFRVFAGGTARALDGADAPANAQHLPCAVIFNVNTAGHTFKFKGSDGVAAAIPFKATGTYGPYRMAPLTFESDGTADSSDSITVFWQPMARC